jgi:Ca2+-binding RTX toxin-like protein
MAVITGNKKNNHKVGTPDPDQIVGLGGNDILEGLAQNDELYGGSGNDRLFGGDGIDLLLGDSGNDILEGGANADGMGGGDGIDTLSYASSNAGVTIVLDATGTISAASGGHAAGDFGDGFENITGSAFDDDLTGNDFRNVLKGGGGVDILNGGAGKDILKGGDDDDEMTGGIGADILDGGAGVDFVIYAASTAGVRITLGTNGAETIGKGGEAQGDRISKVEDVIGSSFNDVLIGNNRANALFGGAGDGKDILKGGGGGDVLFGNDGDDTLIGGRGNDLLNGSTGNDKFVFGPGFGRDTIGGAGADAGLAPGDLILFDKDVFKNFAAVDAASAQVGLDVVITKNADNAITIRNVTLADLGADDFLFF